MQLYRIRVLDDGYPLRCSNDACRRNGDYMFEWRDAELGRSTVLATWQDGYCSFACWLKDQLKEAP